jgi:hypothetical protein
MRKSIAIWSVKKYIEKLKITDGIPARTHQSGREEVCRAVPSTVCMILERGDNSKEMYKATSNYDP